jgi:hypothetical protein
LVCHLILGNMGTMSVAGTLFPCPGRINGPSDGKECVMSAPRTNLETQGRRHRGPIIGIIAAMVFALGLLFLLMTETAENGTPADNGEAEIDGRTGDPTTPADPPLTPPADPPATPEGDVPPAEAPAPEPDLPDAPLPDSGSTTP